MIDELVIRLKPPIELDIEGIHGHTAARKRSQVRFILPPAIYIYYMYILLII